MSAARDLLAAALAPELLAALEQLVDERIEERLVEQAAATAVSGRRWLTLKEAAERLGCSSDAVRMRVRRGRLEARRQGARLYVSAASIDRLGGAS